MTLDISLATSRFKLWFEIAEARFKIQIFKKEKKIVHDLIVKVVKGDVLSCNRPLILIFNKDIV